MTQPVEGDAWEEGPCDCTDCVAGPDVWCCRYCHSLSAGRVIPPGVSQGGENAGAVFPALDATVPTSVFPPRNGDSA